MNLKRPLDDDTRADSGKRLKRDTKQTSCNTNKIRFTLGRVEKYDFNFPFFRQPKEIGFLSLDIKRQFRNDRSQLRYYVRPCNMKNVNYDLKVGYKDMIRKDDNTKEYINDILRWINLNSEKFSLQNNRNDPTNDLESQSFHLR